MPTTTSPVQLTKPAAVKIERERDVEAVLVATVKQAGGRAYKAQWVGTAGCPDRYVVMPATAGRAGRACWVELKAPDGRVSPAQHVCILALRAAGQSVYILRSLQEVYQFVEKEL